MNHQFATRLRGFIFQLSSYHKQMFCEQAQILINQTILSSLPIVSGKSHFQEFFFISPKDPPYEKRFSIENNPWLPQFPTLTTLLFP
jgi:hypothetical protein